MKKVIKNKRLLRIKIISVLLSCCLLISVAYTYIIFTNEKNNLINSANIEYLKAYDTFEIYIENHTSFYYLVNARTNDNHELNKGLLTDDFKNTQIIVRNDEDKIVGETGNYYASNFKIYSEVFMDIYIDLQKLNNLISKNQYNEIINILTSSDKYRLVCTEFTYKETEIIPVELTIVKAENNEYSNVYKHYSLTTQETTTYTNDDYYLNIIPTDFLLGEYNATDVLNNLTENDYSKFSSIRNIVELSPFSFIFREKGYSEFYKKQYTFEYVRQYNILEYCQEKIIIGNLIIFLFFFLTGILLFIMVWNIIKNQIIQEENRKTLTNTIAHNLKTPLFIISGYAENLMENVNTDKRNHYAQVIKNQTEVMNDLIHQMLDFSKTDMHTHINKEIFSITQLTKTIVNKYCDTSNKHIICECCEEVNVNADKKLIKTVIENLIDNAIKYTTDNIVIKLNHNSFSVSNPCLISNKKDLQKIWQPYYRINNTNPDGNGLGLSIVKHILELHKYRFTSEYKNNNLTIVFYF